MFTFVCKRTWYFNTVPNIDKHLIIKVLRQDKLSQKLSRHPEVGSGGLRKTWAGQECRITEASFPGSDKEGRELGREDRSDRNLNWSAFTLPLDLNPKP